MSAAEHGHSEGPWTVAVHDDDTTVEGKYQTVAMLVSNCDADLIAAAPDLLAALKAVVEIADRRTAEFDQARVAIAKAEGQP